MATAVCAISLNFYEMRKFLSTTSEFQGLMDLGRKCFLLVSGGHVGGRRGSRPRAAIPGTLRKEKVAGFCLRTQVGRRKAILNFLAVVLILMDS